MQVSSTLLAATLAAIVSATPQDHRDDAPLAIRAILRQDRTGNELTSLKIYDMTMAELYGESDSSSIATGNFAKFPIVFEVDDHGYGYVSVGDKNMTTTSDNTDGAECYRTHDKKSTLVDCDLPIDPSWKPESIVEL